MQHIKEILDQSQLPKMSPQEVLENYKHVELTEEETAVAILQAKVKKEAQIKALEREQRAQENRRLLTETRWSYEQTKAFMTYRAGKIFDSKWFRVDESNQLVYDLLLRYFSQDPLFESLAKNVGIVNPSLSKGIFLAGNFGVGKTWLMTLFQKNQRQCFVMVNAAKIANQFSSEGESELDQYILPAKTAYNDAEVFYQPKLGLCIDDLGTEDIKVHYGNKLNVIGSIIEKRYARQTTGDVLHATTNLKAEQLNEFYGGRVTSRMREIFNFIELPGNDRRI